MMRTINLPYSNRKAPLLILWVICVAMISYLPQIQVESAHMATILSFSMMLWLALAQYYQSQYALWTTDQWAQQVLHVLRGNMCCLIYAYTILTLACVQDDFSVRYVWQNVHQLLPWWYKPAIPWAAHEGSWLLWWVLLSIYSYTYTTSNAKRISTMVAPIQTLASINMGFGLYALLASNAFTRILPIPPPNGMDLNPLLQDPGFLIHPPCLYIGYVSFVVPYLMSIECIHNTKLWTTKSWLERLKPWALWTWSWLTLGISLGSWWAYRELGWGGWWFWDPVENVSLMPWLCATVLLHTAYQQPKQGVAWAVGVSITGFILSLIGTLLIRSGLLVSVHSFVSDPLRGAVLFIFIAFAIYYTLLSACKFYRDLQLEQPLPQGLTYILQLQGQLLLAILGVVFIATLYPMIHEYLYRSTVSVGAGYYEQVLTPFVVILTLLLSLYPYAITRRAMATKEYVRLGVLALLGIILDQVTAVYFNSSSNISLAIMCVLTLWVIDAQVKLGIKRVNMLSICVHIIMTILMLVMMLNKHYERSWMIEIKPHIKQVFDGYSLHIDTIRETKAFNYQQQEVALIIKEKHNNKVSLKPSLRYYPNRDTTQAKVAIASQLWGDWLVALAKPTAEGPLLVRIYQKPLQIWLWMGALMLASLGVVSSLRTLVKTQSKTIHKSDTNTLYTRGLN